MSLCYNAETGQHVVMLLSARILLQEQTHVPVHAWQAHTGSLLASRSH